MRLYSILLVFLFIFSNANIYAQQTDENQEDNTITGQFDKVIEKSNSYQHYKVVPKENLIRLKKNVLDSLAKQQKNIDEKIQTIKSNNDEIAGLNEKISGLEADLATVRDEKESMNLFGISIQKDVYSLIMWSLILILAGLLAWYIARFAKGNVVTKKSVRDLQELQKEYDEHRKTSLEREQKVRRQLQDEINKNRGI